MSRRALSPQQFGLLPHDRAMEREIGEQVEYHNVVPRRISLDKPLRASQNYIHPKTVESYTKKPPRDPDDRPMVVRYGKEHVIWGGHHRIIAARQRGQKTMRVDFTEVKPL